MTKAEHRKAYRAARSATARQVIEGKRKIRQEYVYIIAKVAKAVRANRFKPFLEEQIRAAFPRQDLYNWLMALILNGRANTARLVADIEKRYIFDALDKAPGHGLSKEKIAAMFEAKIARTKIANSRPHCGMVKNAPGKTYAGTGYGAEDVRHDYTFHKSYSLSKSVWDTVNATEEKILDAVHGGISQGRDIKTVAADLMKYVQGGPQVLPGRWGKLEQGTKEHARRLGKAGIDYRAMRLYRSEKYRQLQEEAVEDGESNPACTGEYDWIVMDGKCGICGDLGERGPYTADTIPAYPHPNCFCVVEPRLKDDDEFIRQLRDYVRGEDTPGAHEIEEWALGNSLIADPGIIEPGELGPNYDPERVEWFKSRNGEKIISVKDEMSLIKDLGIAANGQREYVTIFSEDGTILHTQEGTTPGEIDLPKNIRDLLLNKPKPAYSIIHNHASGESFSLGDLEHLVYYRGIKSMMAIGHNGLPYIMSISGGTIPTIKELRDFYTNKFNAYWDVIRYRMANNLPLPSDIDLRWLSGLNKAVKREFNWYYYDEVKYE